MKISSSPAPDLPGFWSACAGTSVAFLLAVGLIVAAFSYFMEDSLLRGATRSKVVGEGCIGLCLIPIVFLPPSIVLYWSLDYLACGTSHNTTAAIVLLGFEIFIFGSTTFIHWMAVVTRVKDNVHPVNDGSGLPGNSHGSSGTT